MVLPEKQKRILELANAKLLKMRQNYQAKQTKKENSYSFKIRQQTGTGKTVQIEDLFKTINKELKKTRRHTNNKYLEVWKKVVGEEISQSTKPGNIINGFLNIKVNNPVLKSELENFCSDSLLELLKTEINNQKLRGLKFILVNDLNE